MTIVLKAYANPYAGGIHALDHLGRPRAFMARCGMPDRLIGATMDQAAIDKREYHYVPTGEPEELHCVGAHDFAYYRNAFHDGSLVAADEATAKHVGLKYAPPTGVISAAKTAAEARWVDSFGPLPGAVPPPKRSTKTDPSAHADNG